jgi:hypothetical protein
MMDEEMVRELVRQAVARRLGEPPTVPMVQVPQALLEHASHRRYLLKESGGPCIIEPGVRCSHCGYCESHGY